MDCLRDLDRSALLHSKQMFCYIKCAIVDVNLRRFKSAFKLWEKKVYNADETKVYRDEVISFQHQISLTKNENMLIEHIASF